ncbi:class I SAM-dependent methyltransferase [Rhizobium sp. R339]|uniref:class I SAM-dependent methyltransferase n=1 Tax=Rhizobium sp. R339 TaxID=1764273 RepID=UPI00167D69E4|nr:class I SAM-dependent methyltransferase [Rhizobium sp. R339]
MTKTQDLSLAAPTNRNHQATGNYSDRAEHYAVGRPFYPAQVAEILLERLGLVAGDRIADVGAGTGLFSLALLKRGFVVDAVEPDAAMRLKASTLLASFAEFRAHGGSAESIPLPDQSVAAVTVAQALHWFDREKARSEFRRIVRPGGYLLCVWNERRRSSTPFLRSLEQLLVENIPLYGRLLQADVEPKQITEPFSVDGSVSEAHFINSQSLKRDVFLARIFSSSFCPHETDPNRPLLEGKLHELFEKYAYRHEVSIEYDTVVTFCRLTRRDR